MIMIMMISVMHEYISARVLLATEACGSCRSSA